MEAISLAASAAGLIARFLPQLKKITPWLRDAGEDAADTALQELQSTGGKAAKELWDKLSSQIELDPYAKMAVDALAKDPDADADRDMLAQRLDAILKANPGLATQVDQVLQKAEQSGVGNVWVYADRGGVVVAGDASGPITTAYNASPQASQSKEDPAKKPGAHR